MTQVESKKEVPAIKGEEDIPFEESNASSTAPDMAPDNNLEKTSDDFGHRLTTFKYMTGRSVLYSSMIAMGVIATVSVALSIAVPSFENELLENAFEVFKLIAMTVLGYIFGSNTSHPDN